MSTQSDPEENQRAGCGPWAEVCVMRPDVPTTPAPIVNVRVVS